MDDERTLGEAFDEWVREGEPVSLQGDNSNEDTRSVPLKTEPAIAIPERSRGKRPQPRITGLQRQFRVGYPSLDGAVSIM